MRLPGVFDFFHKVTCPHDAVVDGEMDESGIEIVAANLIEFFDKSS